MPIAYYVNLRNLRIILKGGLTQFQRNALKKPLSGGLK